MDSMKEIQSTVDSMLNRRSLTLWGCLFKDANTLQGDICILWLNAELGGTFTIERSKTPAVEGTTTDAQH
jgi:hypothetical protein